MRSPFAKIACVGFTLIEMMMGAAIMAIVSAALIGAYIGQSSLNLTARNVNAAMRDATRVMEEIRNQNSANNCTSNIPSIKPPGIYTSWDAWLVGKGKSIPMNRTTPFESVAVTCQDATGIVCPAASQHVTCPDGSDFT